MNIIIGAGRNGKALKSHLKKYDKQEILFFDNNRQLWQKDIEGVKCITYDELIDLHAKQNVTYYVSINNKNVLLQLKDIGIKKVKVLSEGRIIDKDLAVVSDSCINYVEQGQKRLNDYKKICDFYKEIGNKPAYEHARQYIDFFQSNLSAPVITAIETTNVCNLSCPNCGNPTATIEKGFIDNETFELSLSYIPPTLDKGNKLFLHTFGEPLLHKDLLHYLSQVIAVGLNPNISTNAVLLDMDISKELIQILKANSGSELYISFHTEASVKNFCMFYEIYKKELKPFSFFGQILSHNEEEVRKWLFDYGIAVPESHPHIRFVSSHSWAGNVKNRLFKYSEQEVKNRKRNCIFIQGNQTLITWNGDVIGCCMDFDHTTKIGTIFDFSNAHYNINGYDMCQNCDPGWYSNGL